MVPLSKLWGIIGVSVGVVGVLGSTETLPLLEGIFGPGLGGMVGKIMTLLGLILNAVSHAIVGVQPERAKLTDRKVPE